MTIYRCAHAWIDGAVLDEVDVIVDDGRIIAVQPAHLVGDIVRLEGLVLPGFANAHSHAFHRALRGRTHADGGTFWTWREAMYALAGSLDPDLYFTLARAAYGEMALAGITCVGEFHYLHHQPDGRAYADPNAMGEALRQAAREAGIRLTLLDTCYLAGGLGPEGTLPLRPEQVRFSDGNAQAWIDRVSAIEQGEGMRVGAAIHSVRAVPRDAMPLIAAWCAGRPLHAHLSEQVAENLACQQAYGISPTQVLDRAGVLRPNATMVHATHLSGTDISLLGSTGTIACFCPTTERDLADGIGPARALIDAGCSIVLGSDQHAVIDPIEEARALEMHERLVSGERGRIPLAGLVSALTTAGHRSLGWPDAGTIAVGQRADLVCISLDSVRTAGSIPDQALLAAGATDVRTVVCDGRVIVHDGRHQLGDIGRELQAAVTAAWAGVT
jgi:formiminoglutamate deiminase